MDLSWDPTCDESWTRQALDSALILRWAPFTPGLYLDVDSFRMPGFAAFVQAACHNLNFVRLRCTSALEAAQAGSMLASCTSECVTVQVEGLHCPTSFPPAMQALVMKFAREFEWDELAWDAEMPQALLCTLARQRQPPLEELVLLFEVAGPHLCGPFLLAPLRVRLEFALGDKMTCDLSWLQHQPCTRLEVRVSIDTALPTQHQHMLAQLQRLPLDKLILSWNVMFTLELQKRWQGLTPCKELELKLRHPMPYTLQALPRCPRICISLFRPLAVDWAAVTVHAAQYSFHGYPASILRTPRTSLSFWGGGSIPHHLQGAWQLSVKDTDSVQGLQGALQSGGTQYLQNAAAVKAGWAV